MKIPLNPKGLVIYIAISTLTLFILPAINIYHAVGTSTFNKLFTKQNIRNLYSTDIIEGVINLFLYKNNISGNYGHAIVGRDGWLFLGSNYGNAMSIARGLHSNIDENGASRWAKTISNNQEWLGYQGVHTLFVIAPIKASIYKDKLPSWLPQGDKDTTKQLVAAARLEEVNLIDLRQTLIAERKKGVELYFKHDTHWTPYGASIAYNKIMDALNNRPGKNIPRVADIKYMKKQKSGGDLPKLLKFDNFLSDNDITFSLKFPGDSDEICIHKINKVGIEKNCKHQQNKNISINKEPVYVKNPTALNRMKVLWIRDSFGNANSPLFIKTFSDIWMFHYDHLHGEKLKKFITMHNPDLVIYQIVERSLTTHNIFHKINQLSAAPKNIKAGQLLFELANKSQIISHKNINIIKKPKSSHIYFQTTQPNENDPNITIQPIAPTTKHSLLHLKIESPIATNLQIYYRPKKNQPYNEINSLVIQLQSGLNTINLIAPSNLLVNPLRIDPATHPGRYSMSVKISEIDD